MADKKKITIVGARSDLIVTNRKSNELDDVESKLFTRDIFGEN